MEDDRLADNEDPKFLAPIFRVVGGVIVGFILLLLFLLFYANWAEKRKEINDIATKAAKHETYIPAEPESIPETKADYIKTTKSIGGKKDPIYLKAFLKNPDRYKGLRVRINVKIFDIHESANGTIMNVYWSPNYEPGVVSFYGNTDNIYADDIITVYGEVKGMISGTNAFGAEINQPCIIAKYIKKRKSPRNEEE